MPLLPFSHYRSYSRDDEVDDVEHEDYAETSRRPYKYRYAVDQPNRPRGNTGRRAPALDDYDYDVAYRSRDFDDRDHDYPRRRRRPLKNPRGSTIYEETIANAASSDAKRGRNILDASSKDQEATSRYHEAFQARPNEYEHEFDDEEYLRPRPRKRRPPQNYEFALANAEASSERDEIPRETSKDPPVTTQSPDNNALELKSLLKMQQEEGSSLSEILQRRNLTLSDLLEGKADVINALKAKIADTESEEYIEQMSKVMSNSLMKLAAATSIVASTVPESITATSVASSTRSNSISGTTFAPNATSKSHVDVSSTNTSEVTKKELEEAESETQSVHDSSWPKATTSAILSTVITTTSTSPPVVVNSMEYFLNDDGNAESTSDQRGAARLESLDEDEIMEFSDFMDYKKGKNQAMPTLLTLPSGKVASRQTSSREIVSTLSIEHILHPTERIEPTRNSQVQDNPDDIIKDGEEAIQSDARSAHLDETSVADYSTFIEAEYQNDAPMGIPEGDRRQSDPSTSRNGALARLLEQQRIANPPDDSRRSHDKDHSTEYHQVNRSAVEMPHALENHRNTSSERYEDVVSELEPEARAEISELFASGSAGKRLERLLKSRNMSVEELIALRQRGSSRVHLTEVSRLQVPELKNFHQKSSNVNREAIGNSDDGPHGLNKDGKISEKEEDKRNQFRQDIMSYLHDPLFDRDPENTSLSKLLDLVERDKNASRETFEREATELENSRRAVEIVDLLTTFGSLPFAADVRRQFGSEFDNEEAEAQAPTINDNASVVLIADEETVVRSSGNTSNAFDGYVEEPEVVRSIYSETASDEEEDRTPLSRVKPSIIASGVILGVTIVVFMAIFVVCRIRQKQRYRYRNTFSRTVFQGPIAAARKLSNSSSLSAVMVNVAATSTTRRPERPEMQETVDEFDSKSDMDNDSLDANDSWETIPDYAK